MYVRKTSFLSAIAFFTSCSILVGCSTARAANPAPEATASSADSALTVEALSLSEALSQGSLSLKSLDFDTAISAYEAAIVADPLNAAAYAGLYTTYAASGQPTQALKVLDTMRQHLPDDSEFIAEVIRDAQIVHEVGGGTDAVQQLCASYDPIDADESVADFIQQLSMAQIAMEPENSGSYASLFVLYVNQGLTDDALFLLETATTNGVDLSALDSSVSTLSDGLFTTETLTNSFVSSEGFSDPVVEPSDAGKSHEQIVMDHAAEEAASDVLQAGGFTEEEIESPAAQEVIDVFKDGLSAAFDETGDSDLIDSMLADVLQ